MLMMAIAIALLLFITLLLFIPLLIPGSKQIGVNPKINNLIQGYDQAQHDIIWIIDSNIHVTPDTLTR